MEALKTSSNLQATEQDAFDRKFSDIVNPIAERFQFGEAFEEELNAWQKIAAATNDVVTPANGIDAAGFAAAMYGLNRLDSWWGIGWAAGGIMADMVDGKVARATGTQSPLGEAIDAGGDKIKLAYALYKIWQLELAPKPITIAIAVQNGLNASLTTIDQLTNRSDHVLHPTQFGKKAILFQEFGLGLHVIGNEVAKTNEKRARIIKLGGTALGTAGIVLGGVATIGYASTLWHHRAQKRR